MIFNPKEGTTTIEEDQRFSQSVIWEIQRGFFSNQGVEAWRQGIVPHYVTSNPYLALTYVRVVLGWLRDIAPEIDPSQPIYIFELGTGSGRFGYHFIQTFFDLLDQSSLRDMAVTYVMTDFNRRNLEFWKEHDQLKPWVESGQLDFAKFDADSDDTILLQNRGERLAHDTMINPATFIANYFFDGLPIDIFHIRDGIFHEHLIKLTVPHAEPDLNDPDILDAIEINYNPQPATTDYYSNERYNAMLEAFHKSTVDDRILNFPVGALDCLGRIHKMTNGRFFMLTADKGYHRKQDYQSLNNIQLAIHGSFSMLVNYQMMEKYVTEAGGHFWSTPYRHHNLDICGIMFTEPDMSSIETEFAFRQNIIQSNPDDFYMIKSYFETHFEEVGLHEFLSYLRYSNWDARLFRIYYPVMMKAVTNDIALPLKYDFHMAMLKVWDMYFHIGESYDLPFNIAVLLYSISSYEAALPLFETSLELYGHHYATICNLGMCHYALKNYEIALDYAEQSLALEPDHELAHKLKADALEGLGQA